MSERASDQAASRLAAVVRSIPRGRVATYGQVAELAGRPRAARMVGRWLFHLPPASRIPWHRVINAQGRISTSPSRGGAELVQRRKLEAEGIEFSPSGRIDLRRFRLSSRGR